MQGNVWLILLFAALLLILVVYLWLTQPIDEPITRPKTPPPRQTPDEPIEPPPPALLHSLTPEPITAAFELPTSQPTGRGRLPPSAPLDPADPLVQQYDAAVEKLRSTLAAIDGVPVHLHDLVAMRVECMAIADVLDSVRRTLQATDSGALGAPGRLTRVDRQLTSMRRDAEAIASSYATLESLDATVRVEARVLRVQRHELANAARLPIKWSDSGPTSAAALALVDSLPAPQTLQHSDGVKRQLALVRGLLSDIDAGRAAVASACEQRQILLALLDSPELAKQPTWNRAIAVVCQRARTVGERLEPADALVVLGRESDTLLACVDAFRARVMPNGVRGSHLPEAELGALIQDGQCLQGEVQALWERTRILAAAGTGPARR